MHKILSLSPKTYSYFKLLRLHQPTGIWLLLWPCLWSLALAAKDFPDPQLVLTFIAGSIIMRAAGCIINDLVDIEIDKKVERTKTRPLASNKLSKKEAYFTLFILLLCGLSLLLTLNKLTIILGLISIIPVIIYPFMKRITYWPQAFLGITFNFGALMGWSAVTGQLTLIPFILYAGCIAWTLGYDTIYAHQDKLDDMLVGVKSTALKFGDSTKEWLQRFYNTLLLCLFLGGKLVGLKTSFYFFFIPMISHLYWQINFLDLNDPKNCWQKFKSNIIFGAIVFIAILSGKHF